MVVPSRACIPSLNPCTRVLRYHTLHMWCLAEPEDNRYDRQERLWSVEGQSDLRTAHVWVIGKSLVLMEALKDIVLAGVGELTLTMDEAPSGYYLDTHESPLAEQLRELNHKVSIRHADSPKGVPSILLVDVDSLQMENRSFKDYSNDIIKVVVGSRGMRGGVGIDMSSQRALPILRPRPAGGNIDLRFHPHEIWPEYQRFCDKFDMSNLDEVEHRHVPFCVLLVKAVAAAGPQANADKVRAALLKMKRYADEDNFNEALKHIWLTQREAVPSGVRELIAEAQGCSLPLTFQPLYILGVFVEKHGRLPVSGPIPDMTCETANYIELKNIYQAKAKADVDEMRKICDTFGNCSNIPLDDLCKNARVIRAYVPTDDDINGDCLSYLDEFKGSQIKDEIAAIAAFVGGVAAQELVKLEIKQFTPLAGTIVYDAITQTTKVHPNNMKLIN